MGLEGVESEKKNRHSGEEGTKREGRPLKIDSKSPINLKTGNVQKVYLKRKKKLMKKDRQQEKGFFKRWEGSHIEDCVTKGGKILGASGRGMELLLKAIGRHWIAQEFRLAHPPTKAPQRPVTLGVEGGGKTAKKKGLVLWGKKIHLQDNQTPKGETKYLETVKILKLIPKQTRGGGHNVG